MKTPEEAAWEFCLAKPAGTSTYEALVVLLRARDTEVLADDPVLRAWVGPGINPPYHERMRARVRKIMPVLARHLDQKEEGIR